jgi:N-acetylglucosaminyldiphosphoundecaprenol N-acetyl-beta-D-mannosaminyltransferase
VSQQVIMNDGMTEFHAPLERDAARELVANAPKVCLGGLPIAILDRAKTADLMLAAARLKKPASKPLIFSSANGEVLSRCARDPEVARLFLEADLRSADGQPLVLASRCIAGPALPERVATTDLFHDVANRAVKSGQTFYLFGATEAVNREACRRAEAMHPGLRIVGSSHGYLQGNALDEEIARIREIGPDVLWVALGVPREQIFCETWASRLDTVGAIKTSGGLFDFLAGARRRAPVWLQAAGAEWAYRLAQEPRRLWRRYAKTNPHAAFLLLTRSSSLPDRTRP